MHPVFPLGIQLLWDELQRMPAGGIWWINTNQYDDAVSLVNSTIAAQSKETATALVAMTPSPGERVELNTQSGPEKVYLFSMAENLKGLKALTHDLSRHINPDHFFIILLLSNSTFENILADELRRWLSKTAEWAKEHSATLLVINSGINIDRLTSLLVSEYQSLSGLAEIHNQSTQRIYDVVWWCSDKGVSGRQHFPIAQTEQGWEILDISDNAPQSRSDARSVLSHTDVLEGAPALSEHWHLYSSNDALFNAARKASAATVIFSINQVNQVESIAREIHALRHQRGAGLKLVVREQTPCLRSTDERLLLGCGANTVIPWSMTLSRCLAALDNLQDQTFSRHVPDDINILLQSVQPLQLKGYQRWDGFCQAILTLLNNPLVPFDNKGLLVAMRPLPGLRVEQALTLCRPGRQGDIMTIGQGQIFLFLSFCLINDLDKALRHIFPLPVGDIISNRTVWHEDRQIAAQINDMQHSPQGPMTQPLPQTLGMQDSMNVHYDEQGWRRIPTPITLLVDDKQEPVSS